MSRGLGEPAFVLHQWDWSETSLVLDLWTRGQGRLAVVAKGAKRPYSQLRPVLLPFQPLSVQLTRPKRDDATGDIQTLRQAEYAGGCPVLPTPRLMAGFYVNELLIKLLPRGEAQSGLFDAYAATLQALATEDDEQAALRAFELLLLRTVGLLPELDRDGVTLQRLAPEAAVLLRADSGALALDLRGRPDAAAGSQVLSGALCQALEGALAMRVAADAVVALRLLCATALPALRTQLRPLLDYHLGAPGLRTRELLRALHRLQATAMARGPMSQTPSASAPLPP
ncbi:MAG: repair protein RecO [Pseudomonadota bacterium]